MSLDRDALFDSNLEWAAAVARNVHRKIPPSFDRADLEQAARIEMWRRCQTYDPLNEKQVPFRAYAHMYVRGAVLMSVRRRSWKDSTGVAISRTEVDRAPRPDELVAAKQQHQADRCRRRRQLCWLRGAINKLKPVDAYLVTRVYLDEVDVGEIAERVGMGSRDVSRRLSGIVRRLIKAREKDIERQARRRAAARRGARAKGRSARAVA